jgi:hypothetical protein
VRTGVELWLNRSALLSAGAGMALYGVLQAVDGVGLKQAVNAWASAENGDKAVRFAAAETVRWLEWAVRSYQSFVFGLALILFGAAIAITGRVSLREPGEPQMGHLWAGTPTWTGRPDQRRKVYGPICARRLGGSSAKGGSETGGEGTCGRTVRLTMVWVGLGDDQAGEGRMPDQYCEGGHRGAEGQPRVVLRHVGDRKIKEVDHVDVEVNQEPIGTCGSHADSFPSGRARIAQYIGCAESWAWQETERPVFDRSACSVRRLRRLAEEADPIGREQRFSGAEASEFWFATGQVQQVRHAHGVQYPDRIVDWGAKIGAAVEVHQPNLIACFDRRADDGDGQRAFPTDDERDLTSSEDGRDLASGIAQYFKRPSQFMRATLVGIWPPSHNRTVAVIDYLVAGLRQESGKPGRSQRPRRLLLTGPMGCRARRNAK